MNNNFKKTFRIKYLLEGKVEGNRIALTKEFGHYCVEYINDENDPDWCGPCEEDEIVIRNLYWQIVKNGKKLGRKDRIDKFFLMLVDLMRSWDYNI